MTGSCRAGGSQKRPRWTDFGICVRVADNRVIEPFLRALQLESRDWYVVVDKAGTTKCATSKSAAGKSIKSTLM